MAEDSGGSGGAETPVPEGDSSAAQQISDFKNRFQSEVGMPLEEHQKRFWIAELAHRARFVASHLRMSQEEIQAELDAMGPMVVENPPSEILWGYNHLLSLLHKE